MGGATFSYNLALNLETSFTGEDLLYTRLRAGSFDSTAPSWAWSVRCLDGGDADNNTPTSRLTACATASLSNFRTGGPHPSGRHAAGVPSAYPSDMTYDYFTYAGAPGAYNLQMGGGAGITYTNDNWTFSTSYLSTNANSSCPNQDTCFDTEDEDGDGIIDNVDFVGGGVFTDAAGGLSTTQIAYADENWGVAAVATFASENIGGTLYQGNATLRAELPWLDNSPMA